MKKLMTVAAVAALACGCVSSNKNDGGNSSVKVAVIKDAMHLQYDVAQQRVSATDKLNCLFGFITWGSTATHACDATEFGFGGKAAVKNGAYANACDAANCDQIVGARYKVTCEDYFVFQKYNAEITGFPATVKNVEVVDALKNPIKEEPAVPVKGILGLPF